MVEWVDWGERWYGVEKGKEVGGGEGREGGGIMGEEENGLGWGGREMGGGG